jgi:Zn-dependent protease
MVEFNHWPFHLFQPLCGLCGALFQRLDAARADAYLSSGDRLHLKIHFMPALRFDIRMASRDRCARAFQADFTCFRHSLSQRDADGTLSPEKNQGMLLGLAFTQPLLFAAILVAIVVALTFHEYAHAYVASRLGDPTADRMGRLTLDPLAHLDPVGFLMILIAGIGYARPVPFNPAYLKNRRRDPVLIGFAGPASNILMATVFALVLKYVSPELGASNLLVTFLFFASVINVNLAVFNLIPVPPLDGSKALLALLDGPRHARARMLIETRGPLILLFIILVDAVGGIGIISPIFHAIDNLFFRLLGLNIL